MEVWAKRIGDSERPGAADTLKGVSDASLTPFWSIFTVGYGRFGWFLFADFGRESGGNDDGDPFGAGAHREASFHALPKGDGVEKRLSRSFAAALEAQAVGSGGAPWP